MKTHLAPTRTTPQPLILTGADQRFSRSLAQLLLSAERHDAHKIYRWIAFDLGLTPDTLAGLQRRFAWCNWRPLPFDDLPPHYKPETRSFAWKPWAIWQVLQDADAPLLWMDSATVIKGNLHEVFDWTRTNGIYAAHGQAKLRHRCEPQVIQALNVPQELANQREVVANFLGFNPSNPAAHKLVQDWERHARQPDLLLPADKTIERHMNDQAVLNCLLLPLVVAGQLTLPNVDADISAGNPSKMVSTRNKLPPWLPLWADPLARLWYWTYKTVDQALWRRRERKP